MEANNTVCTTFNQLKKKVLNARNETLTLLYIIFLVVLMYLFFFLPLQKLRSNGRNEHQQKGEREGDGRKASLWLCFLFPLHLLLLLFLLPTFFLLLRFLCWYCCLWSILVVFVKRSTFQALECTSSHRHIWDAWLCCPEKNAHTIAVGSNM